MLVGSASAGIGPADGGADKEHFGGNGRIVLPLEALLTDHFQWQSPPESPANLPFTPMVQSIIP